MWTHTPWQGRFLPHPLPPRERLKAYAGWCDAVEGNTTFYATPSRATVESWAQQTSPDFRFVVKLPKTITHELRLADTDEVLRAFLTAIEPLGPRAHALWIQLPGSFGPLDLGVLGAFLHRLPRTYRYAVEVRNAAFFTDDRAAANLERLLGHTGTEWVPFDTTPLFQRPPATDAEREAWTRKPRLPRRTRALTGHPIIRYLGRDDPASTTEGWRPWIPTVAQWLREGRSPTVFIHTPDNAEVLALAREFHDAVRAEIPSLAPLPEPMPVSPPTLF